MTGGTTRRPRVPGWRGVPPDTKVASNGKVTVKKSTKTGTYKLKVKITTAENATYKGGSKIVTLAVKVK